MSNEEGATFTTSTCLDKTTQNTTKQFCILHVEVHEIDVTKKGKK